MTLTYSDYAELTAARRQPPASRFFVSAAEAAAAAVFAIASHFLRLLSRARMPRQFRCFRCAPFRLIYRFAPPQPPRRSQYCSFWLAR